MIKSTDILSLTYYTYGEPFTGSCDGLRYRIIKSSQGEGDDAKDVFKVITWPEPYSFDNTDDALKEAEYFPFTEDGRSQVVKYLNDKIDKSKN